MAKFASIEVLDAALAVVAGATRLVVLSGQPADYAQADAGRLAQASVAGSDFSVADGDNGSRRLTVAAQAGLLAQASGTADHVALLDGPGQRLIYVTTCHPHPISAGTTVSVHAWQIEIGAPF